jgi:anti-sigma-K factor RskA
LINNLAAEYALGTLRGAPRRWLEAAAARNAALDTAILKWHGRLAMLDQAEAMPTPEIWQTIERRLGWTSAGADVPSFWRRISVWRTWSFAATAVAIALLIVALQQTSPILQSQEWHAFAVLESPQQQQRMMVLASVDLKTLWFTPAQPLVIPAGKSYQLWWIAPNEKPVSAGLLPGANGGRITLQDAAIAKSQYIALAVSVEPVGGSPTGQPTGTVIFQGKLLNPI